MQTNIIKINMKVNTAVIEIISTGIFLGWSKLRGEGIAEISFANEQSVIFCRYSVSRIRNLSKLEEI